MNIEHCMLCDEPTGKAGKHDDSFYVEVGPLCEACYDTVFSRLEAAEALAEALEAIAEYPALALKPPIDVLDEMREIARAALRQWEACE